MADGLRRRWRGGQGKAFVEAVELGKPVELALVLCHVQAGAQLLAREIQRGRQVVDAHLFIRHAGGAAAARGGVDAHTPLVVGAEAAPRVQVRAGLAVG
ncbi:hypothetical protein D3C87_1711770 [compost metagenome]